MANKRVFKKVVDSLCSELIENMMISFVNVSGADKKIISETVGMVLEANEKALHGANMIFGKKSREFGSYAEYSAAKRRFFREHYSAVYADFNNAISESLKLYNSALPEDFKKAQAEALK